MPNIAADMDSLMNMRGFQLDEMQPTALTRLTVLKLRSMCLCMFVICTYVRNMHILTIT
jgi:hypothetical protein